MPMHPKRLLLALLALAGLPAAAQDLSWSGYGTIGYATSNRNYTFQRSISDRGTFDRDSVFGLQGDLRFNPQWSATVQLKAAQSLTSDSRWALTPAWAFIAWRPSDDWLLRAGKLRVPLYLHSEALDVGVTHDMVRQPAEMYSISPTNDFDGLYATRTWPRGEGEVSLDAYAGGISTTARFWTRDGAPPQIAPGAEFVDVDIKAEGVVLTVRQPDGVWRAGVHHIVTRQSDGSTIPVSYPYVDLGNGMGYYQVNPALPGPGIATVPSITNYLFTFGVEQQFAQDWRIAAEFARDVQRDTQVGSDTRGGYAALYRRIGRATPYVSLGVLRSSAGSLDWYRRLTANPLPAMVPGAAQVNAAQRLAAESIWALDQRSLAIGSSYAIDNSQKLKFEWMRTHVGQVSRLVDSPPGSPVPHDTNIDVWSVNYNFSF